MISLSLCGLSIGYPSRSVATDLVATLPSGTLTALVGSNGCGKSTLLRTLAGLQKPLGGNTLPSDLGPKDVAIVLTDRINAPALTVEQVVALGRIPHTSLTGRFKSQDRSAVDCAIERCQLTHLRQKQLAEISDGERQRTMIARALAQDTPLILLDEPTAFLDFPSKVEILQLLRELCRAEGKTILLSSHDLEITFQTVDRLWAFIGGKLYEGSPEELAQGGTIARLFPHIPFNKDHLNFIL